MVRLHLPLLLAPGRAIPSGTQKATALVALALTLAAPTALAQRAARPPQCIPGTDLLLVNGRIHTMDAEDRVVSTVHIVGDTFAAVGAPPAPGACTETIDLRGRTVVPGLIDNHNHIVLLGLRPGHDTRLENADSIDEVLETLAGKAAEVPPGEWITSIGGFDIRQFVPPPGEPRFPTLEELDRVTPDHPVYIQMSFAGPGVTNSLGREFFTALGIEAGDDGSLAGGAAPNPSTRALAALRSLQTLEDQKRGTLDAMRYAASLGLTTHFDQGGFPATGTDADGAAHFDPYHAYDALLALHREGELIQRIRIDFLHMEEDPATPGLRARLENAFPEFGDDMLRVVGIGEFTAGASPIIMQPTEAWVNGTRLVAEAGWRNENHSLTPNDYMTIIDGWERINAELDPPGITKLRWVLAHAPFITREYADKLRALGGGVSVLGGWRYISGTAEQNGPPFRMLVESGIPIGMSSDGMQISPMNPWLGLYYVVTGKNARGETINGDQTLERNEALRLYTAANGWFLKEEDRLGSIERGKLADLAVLSADYFDEDATPDEAIKSITSVLTIVDGRIVHGRVEDL
ncbi:MAG TPA: amidohydrolase family protein [Gammaproteobacteria bacterium]